MNSTRCPIEGCTRRKRPDNLFCSYHWLIVANDITYGQRYMIREGERPTLPPGQRMVPAREWSAKVPLPNPL